MSSALSKRLDRLEALLAARVSPAIWRWQMDPEGDPADAVADIAKRDLGRVQIWRWLSQEEAIARGMEQPPPPPSPRAPAQLPAPPEMKLLAGPAREAAEKPHTEQADEPDDEFTRVRVIPPHQPVDDDVGFHGPVGYPRVGDGV